VNRLRVWVVHQAETQEAAMIRFAAFVFAALNHLSHRSAPAKV
jgi:hypothetical protein